MAGGFSSWSGVTSFAFPCSCLTILGAACGGTQPSRVPAAGRVRPHSLGETGARPVTRLHTGSDVALSDCPPAASGRRVPKRCSLMACDCGPALTWASRRLPGHLVERKHASLMRSGMQAARPRPFLPGRSHLVLFTSLQLLLYHDLIIVHDKLPLFKSWHGFAFWFDPGCHKRWVR